MRLRPHYEVVGSKSLPNSAILRQKLVRRARIILACLEGKEIQQVARELKVSVPSVAKWRQRFSLWGLRGLFDRPRPGKPIKYDTAFRNQVLAWISTNNNSPKI
jgi:transposase